MTGEQASLQEGWAGEKSWRNNIYRDLTYTKEVAR